MPEHLRDRLYDELDSLVLIDPHTHINALQPASTSLADILGYHYYTELAHSAGMPKSEIEDPEIDDREKVRRLIAKLGPIENTIQYSWLMEMAQRLFDFSDPIVNEENWESLYDAADAKMQGDDWAEEVLRRSNLEAVFLTNDFDDPLEGFDTQRYIPCLRTDDLVFHLDKPEVRQRLDAAHGGEVHDLSSMRAAITGLFEHFTRNNAKACAISLPPDFAPSKVSEGRAKTALESVFREGAEASDANRRALSNFVFWTLAEHCAEFRLPFDLMIGVNRGVYEAGVHQGRDLYDSRVSLIQYRALFNAFPMVTFPVSVLASVTNQELTSYAWIFPNVVTNGHWWYSNTPTYIEHDASARLEAVPRTKQVAYYSDMYKLEFALPKFNMYKRILAKVLAERFVVDRQWSEEAAVDLGKQVLRGNVETIFGFGEHAIDRTARQRPAAESFVEPAVGGLLNRETPVVIQPPADDEDPFVVQPLEDPSVLEPTQDEPTQDEPTQDEPTQDEPTQDEPTQDEPVAEAPLFETEQLGAEEPVLEMEQLSLEEPVLEVEQLSLEEPVLEVEQSNDEAPVVESQEPNVKEPVLDMVQPVIEDPFAEQQDAVIDQPEQQEWPGLEDSSGDPDDRPGDTPDIERPRE